MTPAKRRPWLGLLQIAAGRPAGFSQFGDRSENYLASLAPLLAGSLTLGALLVLSGYWRDGVGFWLITGCSLLTPPVIAEIFCRRWQREAHWALYANILNWAQWLMILVLLAMAVPASFAVAAGLPPNAAVTLMTGGLFGYMLWFHWFAARHALRLSGRQALLLMICVVFGTSLLLQVPVTAARWLGQSAPIQLPSLDSNGSGS